MPLFQVSLKKSPEYKTQNEKEKKTRKKKQKRTITFVG